MVFRNYIPILLCRKNLNAIVNDESGMKNKREFADELFTLSIVTAMKKSAITALCCLCLSGSGFAREQQSSSVEQPEEKDKTQEPATGSKQKLNLSGYIQTQFQWGEEDASLKVGTKNENPGEPFSRIGIRRGRMKFAYDENYTSAVFQFDLTEKGVALRDAYLNVKDPWFKTGALTAGVFYRPFGNEIDYSSSRRESPERSAVFQTLFPEERDLGAMVSLQAPATSPLNFLKLKAGLFAGNGIKQETDSRKDFIGHLSASKNLKNVQLEVGASYYNGGVYQGSENVYTMTGKGFIRNSAGSNKGKFAKREYTGFNGQFTLKSVIGLTQLRAEYLFGSQPGKDSDSKSPNASSLPAHDTYIRDFNGGYIIYVQHFGNSPFAAVLKYDWYDPNTGISGNDIGTNNTHEGDVAQNTFGFGMLWHINDGLRLQAYYEMNNNEKTSNLAAYANDRKDDIFTLRLQYKF